MQVGETFGASGVLPGLLTSDTVRGAAIPRRTFDQIAISEYQS